MSNTVSPWFESIVKDYLTATSQQKDDPEKFRRTHLDIDQIYAEFLGSKQNTFITQEDLRDEILGGDIDEDIRTYILKGETGSGKSQLCQWLDYELQGIGDVNDVDERVPLHIKASETSLEQIITTLAEPLGIDPEVDQVQDLSASKVASAIIANLSANPGEQLRDANVGRVINEGNLEATLKENIRKYQRGLDSGDETEFDPNLISKEDYREIRLKLGTDSIFHENGDVLRQTLRDEIHRHFSHIIGVEDFQSQLREYVDLYVTELEKRPVIICEDVTTFSVLKEQLLDQIIQVESSSFDIVLGYTTGFEQDDLQDALGNRGSEDALTYLQDRAEGYLSLTEDGVAYFLNDSIAVDLVRKYLDVIKEDSNADIDQHLENGFENLYPFNKVTLKLTYEQLLEDGEPRRTPRVLLQKVVRRCLLSSEKQPYQVIEESPNVKDVVPPVDHTRYDSEVKKIATWYGYRKPVDSDDDAPILVHTTVLDAFGVDKDIGEERYEDDEYGSFAELKPNSDMAIILKGKDKNRPILGESTEDNETEVIDDPEEGDNGTSPDGKRKKTSMPDPIPVTGRDESDDNEDLDRATNRVKEFLDWIETGGEYDSSGVLRSGAQEVLNMWYDPTRLSNPNGSTTGTNGIYYTYRQDVPVSIQGPDERDGLSVMVEFGEDDYERKLDLLKVGMSDEFPNSVNAQRLKSWATDSVVDFRGTIRENVKSCLPSELTIEHCLVLAKFMLVNGEFGETELTRELIFDESVPKKDRDYDDPLVSAFERNHSLTEKLGNIQTKRNDLVSLIKGFFLLKKNLVDDERLNRVQQEVARDPERYLSLAQQINTAELDQDDKYRIRSNRSQSGGTKVTTFLDSISDYAVELGLMTDDDLREAFEEQVEPVEKWHDSSHIATDLAELFGTLDDALGTFGVTRDESWQEAHERLTEDEEPLYLSEFDDSFSRFVDPKTQSPFERIALLHKFRRSVEDHDAWEVYEALDEMLDELNEFEVDTVGDLSNRLSELEALNEYQESKSAVIEATEEY